jgi:hypothetical protein
MGAVGRLGAEDEAGGAGLRVIGGQAVGYGRAG